MRFNRFSLWAIVGGILFGTLAANAQANPAALSGQVTSAQEAHDGGRPGQRQARGLDHHHHGGDQREGPLQLPGRPRAARQVHDLDPRRRLHPRRAEDGRDPGRRQRHRRPQAQPRAQHPSAALQRRMDGEPARHRPREAVPHRLHRLPHLAAAVHARSTTSTSGSRCSTGWAATIRARRRRSRNCWSAAAPAASARASIPRSRRRRRSSWSTSA